MHGSVRVDALKRKEAEESACGNVCSKLLKFIFRKNYYVTKMKKLEFGNINAQFRRYSGSNGEVFDAKRISYSELHVHVGFASRILHHKFM